MKSPSLGIFAAAALVSLVVLGLGWVAWQHVIAFRPDLLLVSAGFDAYARDPITSMTLEREDFATLGHWLATARISPDARPIPTAAILEGGYSADLPLLIEAFLTAWDKIS
jgi:acetoin utilization deacetylase AcuC-like enzyme